MKIKIQDKVRVIAGAEKGKEGKVTQVFLKLNRVIIEGVNIKTKHLRGRKGAGGQKGQKVEFAAPIDVSNVQLVGSSIPQGRIGYKFLEQNGKKQKVRILRKGKKTEDIA